MAIKKLTPYLCPECGDTEDVDNDDFEFDCEELRVDCVCHKCDAVWSEYFLLKWAGYAHKGIDYCSDGTNMFPDAPEGT